jgi:site-specific recombinase XerC
MINRSNWKLTKKYLEYRVEVDQLAESSVKVEKRSLRHLLDWMQETPFKKARDIRPTFPQYMLTARRDGEEGRLSGEYIRKVIGITRGFFDWLSRHRSGYRKLGGPWLDTLRAPKMIERPTEHEAVTLKEVRAMAEAPVGTGRERRIRAAAVFLFLSGMRVGAFSTLPLEAVDLEKRTVKQWPSLGVRTKFKKHATTYLLGIPDLLPVVLEWDQRVRSVLPGRGLWFAHLLPSGAIDREVKEPGKHRRCRVNKDLHQWLGRVGLPYHSPHKFRHGHAVYLKKRCDDIADLKAMSQNLMHSSLVTTDAIYSVLGGDDVGARIASMSQDTSSTEGKSREELVDLLQDVLTELRE